MTPRMFWLLFFIVIILLALLGCDSESACNSHLNNLARYDECMADHKCMMTPLDYRGREFEARQAMLYCPSSEIEDAR